MEMCNPTPDGTALPDNWEALLPSLGRSQFTSLVPAVRDEINQSGHCSVGPKLDTHGYSRAGIGDHTAAISLTAKK